MRLFRATTGIGVAMALALVWVGPAAATDSWHDVEVLPGDSTRCEFEAGVMTEYEVDVSTLPQFDRERSTSRERPDGSVANSFKFHRNNIRFLKLDADAPGPSVLIESTTFNLRIVTAASGETIGFFLHSMDVERLPEGEVVDQKSQIIRLNREGEPVIVQETIGVCSQ